METFFQRFMSDEPPSVGKWFFTLMDYLGLGCVLTAVDLCAHSQYENALWAVGLGAIFLFIGVMGPKIRDRAGVKIAMTNQNTGSFTCYRITNNSGKEKLLLSIKMKVTDCNKKVTEDSTVYKRERFSTLPHRMPPGSSIEIYYRSLNAFIDFNGSKPNSSGLKIKEVWLEVELEDGTKIVGRKYKIPSLSEVLKENRRIKAKKESEALRNPEFTQEEMEAIRLKEGKIAEEMEIQKQEYLLRLAGGTEQVKKNRIIEVRATETTSGMISATVINNGDKDERILSIHLIPLDNIEYKQALFPGSPVVEKTTQLEPESLLRCEKMPYVMPPHSSFEAFFYISFATLINYGLGGYYIRVTMEDLEVISTEPHTTKRPSQSNPDTEASPPSPAS
jgi:hypothetical protein